MDGVTPGTDGTGSDGRGPDGTVQAFAPGKLILLGEHAVVYGHPAVAIAVDRGTTVHLSHLDGASRVLSADIPGAEGDPRLAAAIHSQLPSSGVGVRLRSTLPVGRGMGSSGALAIALVRAAAAWQGRVATLDECLRRGFEVERIFHGTPSGLDHSVSARGGALSYRRGPDGPELSPLSIAPLPLVVLDTGLAGDTSALVAAVRARRPAVDPALSAIGELVTTLLPALKAGDLPTLGQGFTENQRLLRLIGVSTPEIEALVDLALDHGAFGAKLAGAGGGGVVIALHPHPQALLQAARGRGVPAFTVQVWPG